MSLGSVAPCVALRKYINHAQNISSVAHRHSKHLNRLTVDFPMGLVDEFEHAITDVAATAGLASCNELAQFFKRLFPAVAAQTVSFSAERLWTLVHSQEANDNAVGEEILCQCMWRARAKARNVHDDGTAKHDNLAASIDSVWRKLPKVTLLRVRRLFIRIVRRVAWQELMDRVPESEVFALVNKSFLQLFAAGQVDPGSLHVMGCTILDMLWRPIGTNLPRSLIDSCMPYDMFIAGHAEIPRYLAQLVQPNLLELVCRHSTCVELLAMRMAFFAIFRQCHPLTNLAHSEHVFGLCVDLINADVSSPWQAIVAESLLQVSERVDATLHWKCMTDVIQQAQRSNDLALLTDPRRTADALVKTLRQ
eukprot:COSAG01_NODE_25_length_37050_cov_211.559119_8_plen_364_part_00